MNRNRTPLRTLALGMLSLLLVAALPASQADDPVDAEEPFFPAYADTVKASFAAAGVTLSADHEERIEALGEVLDDARNEFIRQAEATARWGWLDKLLGIGMEGCTGEGSCGGTYSIDNHSKTYYQEGAYLTSNVCANSTFVNVIVANSGPVQICYAPMTNKFCIESECEDLSPAQSSGVSVPGPLEPQPTAPVDADVYLGIIQCIWVLSEFSLDPECRSPL